MRAHAVENRYFIMRHLIWRTFQYRREQHCSSCRDKARHIDVCISCIILQHVTDARWFEEDEKVKGW